MLSAAVRPSLGCSSRVSPSPLRQSRGQPRVATQPLRAVSSGGEGQQAAKRWPEEVAPKGVPLPPVVPKKKKATFGFVDNAEVINSRAAMIGFFALILLEAVTNQGILELLGFETGKGIDIGF